MAGSKLDQFLAPWVFMLTGILFNILSAVITHYFIGLNNDKIGTIDRDMASKQVLIDSLWQSKTEVERKQEFFILLLSGQPANPELAKHYYHEYLENVLNTHHLKGFQTQMEQHHGTDLGLLLDLSAAAQKNIIEDINDTYFETLELQEAKLPLERANSRLFSIAIFLQVTGLILVLARDLRRS